MLKKATVFIAAVTIVGLAFADTPTKGAKVPVATAGVSPLGTPRKVKKTPPACTPTQGHACPASKG
jgi:hypothetical protein